MFNQCKSYKNKKECDIQCKNKSLKDSDFCGFHNKTKQYYIKKEKVSYKKLMEKYNINKNKILKFNNKNEVFYKKKFHKILDKLYFENLMCIYDSFNEIPLKYLVFIDKKVWDIQLLLDNWANLLTSSEMQNSSPIFPSNPFTKKNLSLEDFDNIIKCLKSSKLLLYAPLKYLILNSKKINQNISFNTNINLSRKIINLLEEKFRFRLLNKKDSQDNYTGIWVSNTESKSDFEIFYDYYDSLPIQIQNIYGQIYDNFEKLETKKLLDLYPIDNLSINNYLESLQ